MRPWTTGLIGAALGAILTAGIFSFVPRESVETAAGSNASGAKSVAGSGGLSGTSASRTPGAGGDPGASPASTRAVTEATLAALAPAELRQQNLALFTENQVLREKVEELERQLAGGSASRKETYDLSPEELVKMAQACELRWDMPSLTHEPPTLPGSDVAQLGLSSHELEIVNQKLAASHERLVQTVRSTYHALTGDEDPGSMSPEAMYAEILDKVPESELRVIFQRLSHERAGLVPKSADPSSGSPVEQLFRVLTSEGDALEQSLAQDLGPELASSLRDLHNGWNSKFRSTHGCPQ